MGEIKSTIELAMERTRHMSMSDEEKHEQALRKFRETLTGLLLRVETGTLSLEQFEREWRYLGSESELPRKNILLEELAARIDPDEDIVWVLDLLSSFCPLDPEKFLQVQRAYLEQLDSSATERMEALKRVLSRERQISGSAVRPNLDSDGEWPSIRRKVRNETDAALKQEVLAVIGPCLS